MPGSAEKMENIFSGLFNQLGDYIHTGTEIIMVLFEGCDMEMIMDFAAEKGYTLQCMHSKKTCWK